ncbi:MAG: hypothetical protein KGI60_02230 [Patescibacteria group bacterium]|nr:hypothetical protein [Patescibacteria group bacterium]
MTKKDQELLKHRIAEIENEAKQADDDKMRDFLKKKVGRWLIATLLGVEGKRNVVKADAYLFHGMGLPDGDEVKIRQCYLAALIIDEIRFFAKGGEKLDRMLAKNWLMMTCSDVYDDIPICAIRDGKTHPDRSVLDAAKTFVLRCCLEKIPG